MSKSLVPVQDKRTNVTIVNVDGIIPYDVDNLYPHHIDDLVNSSGMASSCVNLFSKFIRGKGYQDSVFYKSKINKKGLTLDKLERVTSEDISRFGGSAWLIRYNGLFEVDEVYHIPFKWCRLAKPDDNDFISKIAVYDDWECKKTRQVDKDKIVYYDVYNPSEEAIKAQIEKAGGANKYKGQIYWSCSSGLMAYPLPIYDSVREDIAADASLKEFRMNNIYNSFAPAVVAEYGYEFADDEERKKEQENWKTFKGPKNPNKVILIEHKNGNKEGNAFKLTPIQGNNNDKLYELTTKTVKDSIIEAFNQPKVLLGVQSDGGITFSNDVVKDAFAYYNAVTYDFRLQLEEKTKEVFSKFKEKINVSKDYSIIPLSFGEVNSDSLISKLGIESVNAITQILSSDLNEEQKINTISIVFGLTREQSSSMVLGTKMI